MNLKKNILAGICLIFFIQILPALDVEIDSDKNGKADRWLKLKHYKDWKKFDFNRNGLADESCFYTDEAQKIFFIETEAFDYNNNGKPDVWISYHFKGDDFYTEITADKDENGFKELYVLKINDIISLQKTDNNKDGKYDVEEQYNEEGKKVQECVDMNSDGKMDDFYHYENDMLMFEELDTNFDGRFDQWVSFEYKEDHSIKECVISKDNNYDGKEDEWHYTDDKRRVTKIEKDKDFDGQIDERKTF